MKLFLDHGVQSTLNELTLIAQKRLFFRIASCPNEYIHNVVPAAELLAKLRDERVDIFTFVQRGWCISAPKFSLLECKREEDNVALLRISTFEDWWSRTGRKGQLVRRMVRKAQRRGVVTKPVDPDEDFAEGVWSIYNETPVRQGRSFPHYGERLEDIANRLKDADGDFIGAYHRDELIGFAHIVYGEDTGLLSQIISLKRSWEKAPNNALISAAVKTCAEKGVHYLIYGRMGNHPSLDRFKLGNGFVRFPINRYYIPLTRKGKLAIRLKLHRELKDALPQSIRYPLIPVYNWASRLTLSLNKIRRFLLLSVS